MTDNNRRHQWSDKERQADGEDGPMASGHCRLNSLASRILVNRSCRVRPSWRSRLNPRSVIWSSSCQLTAWSALDLTTL